MNEAASTDAFKIDVHEEPAWRRVIDVEITQEEVTRAFSRAFSALGKRAKFPGFRPGKVPREILEKRLGPEAEREVLSALVSASLQQAYQSHKIVPVSEPKISGVHLKRGEALRYRVEVDIRPTVNPEHYDGLVLEKKKRPITDEDIKDTIERVREQRAEYVTVERPSARGDVVVCDLHEITADRPEAERQEMKDVSLELNPERVFPEFADGLLNIQAGEKKAIDLEYPKEYGNSNLAGRKVSYSVAVKEVKARRLPDMTPEFLGSLSSDITSEDDLVAKVREDLEGQVEQEAQRELNNEIITQVLAKNAIELPASLVDDYLKRLTEDLKRNNPEVTAEEVETRYKEMGIRQVRWEFIYHAIADKEKVTVSDEELASWLERYAQSQNIDPEEAKKQAQSSGQVDRIRDNILENKVLSLLRERSTITELATSGGVIAAPGAGTKS
jgi:trigger factor